MTIDGITDTLDRFSGIIIVLTHTIVTTGEAVDKSLPSIEDITVPNGLLKPSVTGLPVITTKSTTTTGRDKVTRCRGIISLIDAYAIRSVVCAMD
jgi:hypothetical protein